MRLNLLIFIVGLPVVGLLNLWWFSEELRRFLDEVPRLETDRDLERLMAMVRRQMYAALGQIPLLLLPSGLFVYGIGSEHLTMTDLPYVIIPSVAMLGGGMWFRGWEVQVREMPAIDPDMAEARDHIVHVWLHKALPDW